MSALDHLNSSGEEAGSDLETMDVSLSSISCEDDLMTSDFFDSVMSLENDVDGLLSNFHEEINLSSDVCSGTGSVSIPSPRSLLSDNAEYLDGFEEYNDMQQLEGFGEVHSNDNGQLDSFEELNDNNAECLDGFDTKHGRVKVERLESLDDEIPMTLIERSTMHKQPTRILIQNPNNKKFITKPILVNKQTKQQQPVIKILPLNLKNIKILKRSTDEQPIISNQSSKKPKYHPPLALTGEEQRLLAKEGISLPTHHPLTKTDERELKRIRRKIRNKISAQESRKRKKEYIDNLEAKVKRGLDENKTLLQRVKQLQKHNKQLVERVNRLQSFVCSTTSKAAPSTCLMVVLLSALLVSLPNLRLFDKNTVQNNEEVGEQVAVRRSLLSSQQTAEDGWSMDDLLVFKDEEDFESRQEELALDNSTEEEIAKILDDLTSNYSKNKGKSMEHTIGAGFFLPSDKNDPPGYGDYGGGRVTKNGFIEPDIDEYTGDPPTDEIMGVVGKQGSDFGYLGESMRKIVSTTVSLFKGVKTEEK